MLAVVVFSIAASFGTTPTVDFDSRSFVLDGNPELLLSGVVHYARVLPADWNRTFSLMSEMGLNTVQTYVMWNFHEHVRGELVWTGRRDLALFLKTAQDHGLSAVVRIGPYVCGEYYFGGIPIWLRSVDDVQCFRCSDPVWMRESIKFVASVVEELTSKKSLHPQGGNVIMLQIENEWNGPSDEVEHSGSVAQARRSLSLGTSAPASDAACVGRRRSKRGAHSPRQAVKRTTELKTKPRGTAGQEGIS